MLRKTINNPITNYLHSQPHQKRKSRSSHYPKQTVSEMFLKHLRKVSTPSNTLRFLPPKTLKNHMRAFFFFIFLLKKPPHARRWCLMDLEATQEMLKKLKATYQRTQVNQQWRNKCSTKSKSPLHIKYLFTKIFSVFWKLSQVNMFLCVASWTIKETFKGPKTSKWAYEGILHHDESVRMEYKCRSFK